MDPFNPFEDPEVIKASELKNKTEEKYLSFTNEDFSKEPTIIESVNKVSSNKDENSTQSSSLDNLLEKLNQPYNYKPTTNLPATLNINNQKETNKDLFISGELDLKKRQLELDLKAAELEKREQNLKSQLSSSTTNKVKNFPPFPSWFCLKPWYYFNIVEEIPLVNQWLCKMIFRMWYVYIVTLLLNMLTNLAYVMVKGSIVGFILSIILGLLFIILSFIFLIIPIYKAFKSDSSFNYFVFFVGYTIHCLVTFVMSLGVNESGWSGWITVGICLGDTDKYGVGIFMILPAILFTILFVFSVYAIIQTNRIYRHSTASFEKAKGELLKNVTNTAVQSS